MLVSRTARYALSSAALSVENASGLAAGLSRIVTDRIAMRSFGRPFLVGRDLGNLLRDENALADAAEHVVHAVEPGLIGDADEELRAAAVGIPAAHDRRHRAARVLLRVPLGSKHAEPARPVGVDLRRILRQRIAALHNSLPDDAMKRRPRIRPVLRVLDEDTRRDSAQRPGADR